MKGNKPTSVASAFFASLREKKKGKGNKRERNETKKPTKKTHRSRNVFNLGSLCSRSRGLSNRGSLGGLDLLDGNRGGSSFNGRH